jgi:hypothetical protein
MNYQVIVRHENPNGITKVPFVNYEHVKEITKMHYTAPVADMMTTG